MKKIFRKEFFVIDCTMNGLSSKDEYMVAKCTWASDCDGKEVINGRIDRYIIDDEWCEIVEE